MNPAAAPWSDRGKRAFLLAALRGVLAWLGPVTPGQRRVSRAASAFDITLPLVAPPTTPDAAGEEVIAIPRCNAELEHLLRAI